MRGILMNGITMQNLSKVTLQPAPVFPELYEPLWLYSGGKVGGNTDTTSSGGWYVQKGNTSVSNPSSGIPCVLATFSSKWSSSTKCALEVAVEIATGSGTGYVALWDMTSNTIVSGSTVSTTSTTFTVIRSGQFTLTPGHDYGVTVWSSSTSVYPAITDANIIVFPSAPLTSPSVSAISLANPSGSTLKEAYIPLWVYSSGNIYQNTANPNNEFVAKGTTTGFQGTSTHLYTLSSSWSPSQKFALEVSMYYSGSGTAATVNLYDFTSSTPIGASQLSTTTTTATLFRSGSFTLTPGHTYGVAMWGQSIYLTKAHLVALA